MPLQLLPASAAAFAPRSAPTIVLNTTVEPWLTQVLKRINRVKRPLNSVPQHLRCLTETLGGPLAIWTMASLMFPKAPDSKLRKDDHPLTEAMFNFEMLHIEAYVVHIDMISQHEVAFKLTPDTIESLIDYHKDIYCIDISAAYTYSWPEKESQIQKIHEEYVQAINRFVFRTSSRALEGMEEDGAGELLDGRSEDVKNAIMHLFMPLLPPPPRIVDVVHPAPFIPNPAVFGGWWQPTYLMPAQPYPMDGWRILPSTPSPTTTSCSDPQSGLFWSSMSCDDDAQLPSPTPSISYSNCTSATDFFSSPLAVAEVPYIPTPGLFAPHCGIGVVDEYSGLDWGFNTFAAPQYAII